MPQEVSVSYQAIKSKVYRLIDTLVVGDKSEVEVQESIRRWWELIHPADRPIAQKYLHLILERSCTALDAIEEGLTDATNHEATRASDPAKAFKLVERVVKQTSEAHCPKQFHLIVLRNRRQAQTPTRFCQETQILQFSGCVAADQPRILNRLP